MEASDYLKMKLWVDDLRDAPNDSWTVARKVEAAISFLHLYASEITEISLDHDIENRPDDETFYPIALYIAGAGERFRKLNTIILHTINPLGAKRMESVLKDAGWVCYIIPYAPDMERLRREYGIE